MFKDKYIKVLKIQKHDKPVESLQSILSKQVFFKVLVVINCKSIQFRKKDIVLQYFPFNLNFILKSKFLIKTYKDP